jgi:predicted GNAT family acetyltransferase
MDDARARGRTVVPICPFLAKWLDKHDEYGDTVVRTTKKVK